MRENENCEQTISEQHKEQRQRFKSHPLILWAQCFSGCVFRTNNIFIINKDKRNSECWFYFSNKSGQLILEIFDLPARYCTLPDYYDKGIILSYLNK